jgi:hypothetical protein
LKQSSNNAKRKTHMNKYRHSYRQLHILKKGQAGTFFGQDNVLGVVNICNSLRRPLFSEEKVQIEILNGLHAYMPIDFRNPARSKIGFRIGSG